MNEELTIIKSYFIDIDNGIYEIEEKKERWKSSSLKLDLISTIGKHSVIVE